MEPSCEKYTCEGKRTIKISDFFIFSASLSPVANRAKLLRRRRRQRRLKMNLYQDSLKSFTLFIIVEVITRTPQ